MANVLGVYQSGVYCRGVSLSESLWVVSARAECEKGALRACGEMPRLRRSGRGPPHLFASFCSSTFTSSSPVLLAPSTPRLSPSRPHHALRRPRSPRRWCVLPFIPVPFSALISPTAGSAPQSRSPTPAGNDSLTLRALVSTKDAGVIIGKAGKNVAELREQTGVKAGVSKVIPGVHERVLTVTGSVEGVAKVRIDY